MTTVAVDTPRGMAVPAPRSPLRPEPVLPVPVSGLARLLDAAERSRREPDLVTAEAVRARRRLARHLVAHGLPTRDAAALLGVSPVRVRRLLGAASTVSRR